MMSDSYRNSACLRAMPQNSAGCIFWHDIGLKAPRASRRFAAIGYRRAGATGSDWGVATTPQATRRMSGIPETCTKTGNDADGEERQLGPQTQDRSIYGVLPPATPVISTTAAWSACP